ncbi:MAG: aspartate 1-decarboxylase [Candidatus Omnitrophota bacterium]|jgi:aspartate 1-decarboxylase|nr:MAG: aspartate 1-decarboxylase [Candidatus Omnitrophota bacterium]
MYRHMLKSKIQEARVTGKEIHYAGSLAIDMDLLEAADICCGEEIHVYNMNNGARLTTYAIPAPKGSGIISVKGAAGRLIEKGDVLLIVSFAMLDEDELKTYSHRIVYVDEKNHLVRVENRTEEDYLVS